ncbi:MAG: transporter substrate-binding domain-containing protein [Pontiellaceae bacterium]|nr:transporter substrate-binding domain-containing protein [Pontiellaceae bacterium]
MKKAILISAFLSFLSATIACGQIIRSAIAPDYPPFSMVRPDGTVDGFSVDLLEAAAKAMGRSVSFKAAPWEQITTELANNEIDVLPVAGLTKERQAVYDFTAPYIVQYGAIFVRADCTDIQSLSDLPGKRVVVVKGGTAEEYMMRKKLSDNLISTTTSREAFQLLATGQADAVIAQKLAGVSLLNEMGITNIWTVGPPNEELREPFCFAVIKGRKGLLDLLNDGLAQVYADGTYQQIYRKWMTNIRYDALMSKIIVVGGDRNYPPYEFLNEQGVPDGFTADLIQAIEKAMGLSIQLRLDVWSNVVSGLRTGSLDAVVDMTRTSERAEYFDFSTPHLTTYAAVYSGPNSPAYRSISSLNNRRVAVRAASINEKILQESAPEAFPVCVESEVAALELLARGEVAFALVHRPASDWIIKNGKLKGLRVEQDDLYRLKPGFSVQKGNDELIQMFEEGLRRVKENGEYDRLRKKWLSIEQVHLWHIIKPYLYWGLVSLLLLTLLTALWIHALKKQVQKKTASLRESEERFEIAASAGKIGIWDWDIVNDRLMWDGRMRTLCGVAPEQFGGTVYDWKKSLHPEDKEKAEQALKNALSGKTEFNTNYRIIRPDGETRHIRAFGKVIRDSAGKPLRMIGTNHDITTRKQMEQELLARNNELERFNRASVGRELRMIELKNEINELCHLLGRKAPYLSHRSVNMPEETIQ